jgi:hypothetical protein
VFALGRDSKVPVTEHGFKNATTDPEWVRTQLSAPSAGNYGMTWPVEAPPVVVFDLDDGGGEHERTWQERLLALIEEHGPLPSTKATDTPSGGKHAFYRWPSGLPIPPGDELFAFTVRWPGRGYVVGPGSSIGGKGYVSNGKAIADLPEPWVRAAIPAPSRRPGTIVIGGGFELPERIGSGKRYATVRDFSASRWAMGLHPAEIWKLVLAEVAPRFETPKAEAELIADFERAMSRIEERLGPQPRKGLPPEDAIAALQPITALALSEYAVEAVVWLWHRFLPVGSITLFDGNPGEGKSTVVADLVARLTAGTTWPDGTPVGGPGAVLYITKEDDPRTQVRPGIEAAGGDVRLVRFVDADLLFPRDIGRFRELLADIRPRLVLLDPLMSYLEGRVRAISDNEVRSAIMTPLAEVSREHGCATLVIRHFNKGTGQAALNRGAGSLGGLAGSARMVLSLTTHPGEADARVFGVIKSNYEAKPRSLKVVIEAASVEGFHMTVSRANWVGESDVSITEAMERDSEQHERVVAAAEDLREILDPMRAVGGVESAVAKRQMKARGRTERAIRDARVAIGAVITRTSEVPSGRSGCCPRSASSPVVPVVTRRMASRLVVTRRSMTSRS